ncbi:F-box/kelch-repeat protein-like [Dorcoceras hygrometricum]|uniref:F-box/kelch-repeat protein-like n=1 Tax=Dorcoceras hygrometricum TaxID=472368 RepID=A0A2Z7BI13_9LAMI|nr:F-box/kelch-repeat protein-like [Dorcoceras hygrometricum]
MKQSSQFTNLPFEIITNILSRLPVLVIVRLKCVCKAWLAIFESPEFSKLHLARSSAGLLVYQHLGASCLLKMFGFEDEPEVERHENNYTPVKVFDLSEFRCQTIAGSVDGFLCLRVVGHIHNLYILNPITREYITLPTLESRPLQSSDIVTYGFGVSSSGCQYKVVRIFHESELDQAGVCVRIPRSECHVYTLGTTGTWRSISIAPSPPLYYDSHSIGALLNGNLHWLARDLKDSYLISCLDLDAEVFRTLSAPPLLGWCLGSLVALGDRLTICDNTSENDIVIWIMKDYGVGKSWTKEFVISKLPNLDGECYDLVLPIKVFRNGDILMVWADFYMFYYSKRNKTISKIDIIELACCGSVEAILHVPALVSLTCFEREMINSY